MVTLHLFMNILCNIHIQDIGYAFLRVKMMGELGKGGVALRDICMVVQLQLDIG